MKTLCVVRHAKSSWDDPDLRDFDRPLNHRGKKDAPRMGKRLRERKYLPDAIYSSPAVRAYTTAKLIAHEIGFPEKRIIALKDLYHAEEEEWLRILQEVDNHHKSVMMFGHNPGLTDFVDELLDADFDNVPTTGVVLATLPIDSWKAATWGCGKLVSFDYPKKKD